MQIQTIIRPIPPKISTPSRPHLHHGPLDVTQRLLGLGLLDLEQRPLLVGGLAEGVDGLLGLCQLREASPEELLLVRDLREAEGKSDQRR